MGSGASLEAAAVMPQVRQEYDKLVKGEITEEQACAELKKMIITTPGNSPQKEPAPEDGVMSPGSPNKMRRHMRAHSWQRSTHEATTGDKWETTMQPVCHLCKMVFPNQLKLDRHIQYSIVHKKNVEAQAPEKDKAAAVAAPAPIPIPQPSVLDMDIKTGQLMYSGSKFFWRSAESYDVYIYLHPHHNCLEVIACDYDVELRRLYLNFGKVVAKCQAEPMSAVSDTTTQESDSRPSTPVPESAREAESLRRQFTHFILARLQLKTFSDIKGLCLLSLGDDATVEELTFTEPPAGLPHTSVRKRRRTSISDFEKLLDNFQQNAKELESNTTKASSLINASVETVQQLTKGRRRHLHQSMSRLPEAKRRWDEASVKGTLVLDVDKTKRLLQDMAEAVQQAESFIKSPSTNDSNT